jgi:copper homeostasis protein
MEQISIQFYKSFELACFNISDGLEAATKGYCDRIELCSNRIAGGVTPQLDDFIDLRRAGTGIPIYIMIRPREGNFLYSRNEFSQMERDMSLYTVAEGGADGFVFGILDEENRVDRARCSALIDMAGGKPCTFHRAFDSIPPQEMESELETVIECGFEAILTSGGPTDASEGREMLGNLVKAAGDRICIIVGGGVRSSNLRGLMTTGAMVSRNLTLSQGPTSKI